MRAQVVYFEGCPNSERAAALVREVASTLAIDIEVDEVLVVTPEDAVRERMLGSPTILIHGVDVEPDARQRTDFSMSCRVYAGLNGLPSRAMVRAAIAGEKYRADDDTGGCQSQGCCE